jgi:hypothetical protein
MMKIRKDKISKLNEQHQKLCLALGTLRHPLPLAPLPCEETIEKFENVLEAQREKYEKRIQTFLEKQQRIRTLTCKSII